MTRSSLVVLAFCVLAIPGIAATSSPDDAPRPLLPGTYKLTLTVLEGPRNGVGLIPDHKQVEVTGTVTLRPTIDRDRSPRTGEKAADVGLKPLLYGWTDARLSSAVPLEADAPSPDSRDPVYPGLLVIRVPYGTGGPFTGRDEITAILVNTLGNARNGQGALDGGGFGMFVLRWDGECHQGRWSPWGILQVGSGTFRLCPL